MNTERTTPTAPAVAPADATASVSPLAESGGPSGPASGAPPTRAAFAAALGRHAPPTRPDGSTGELGRPGRPRAPSSAAVQAHGDVPDPRPASWPPLAARPVEAAAAAGGLRGASVAAAAAVPVAPPRAAVGAPASAVPVDAGGAGRFLVLGDGSVVVTRSAPETAAVVQRSRQRGWTVTTPADAGSPPRRVP